MTPARRDDFRCVLLWGRWTPYHHARLRGLREALGSAGRVIPVQYSAGSRDYGWMRQLEESGLVTLRGARCETRFSLRALLGGMLPLLLREEPDVVFVPAYWHWSLATALLARMAGARVVTMNESHAGTVKPGRLRRLARRMALRLFDAAFVGGAPQRRLHEAMGMDPRRIVTGYDAVDNDFFAEHARMARADEAAARARLCLPAAYILWAGRMEPKKDLPTLVHAYGLLARGLGADAPALLVVGDGVERPALLAAVAAEGLQLHEGPSCPPGPCVCLRPFLAPAELAAAYALSRCMVLASRLEEWGLVTNEALAAGTPVVVSAAAGCAEDLLPGPDDPAFPGVRVRRSGLLFDPGDAAGLANALRLLHTHPSLRERLRREAPAAAAPFSTRCFGFAALQAVRRALM